MYKKFKKDKEEVRQVSEAAAPAYRADSHSESDNDYADAGGHTSSESSRTAAFISVIVKSIMNNMENTIFAHIDTKIRHLDIKLSTKIATIDKKVDSKFTALEKSIADVYRNTDIRFAALNPRFDALDTKIESLETNMNTKFAAVYTKIDAVETKLSAKIKSLETNMNTKFEAVDVKISALDAKIDYKIDGVSNELKLLRKLMFGGMTIILAAIFEPKITDLIMKLFGG